MRLAVNALLFQLGWFICVFGGAQQLPWLGVLAAVAIVAVHLATVAHPGRALALIAITGAIGFTWDSMLVALGLFTYPSGVLLPAAAPVWILALWWMFATTLNASLRWLRSRPWLAAVCGAIGAPAAFHAGAALGAVEYADPLAALVAQGCGWAVMLPLLLALAARLETQAGAAVRAVPGRA